MQATKPRVTLVVLAGPERTSWINPGLCASLISFSHDPRFCLAAGILARQSRSRVRAEHGN
jgi:hypothetical protein